MHGIAIDRRMHSNAGNSHFTGGADHAKGNFAPIGDKDFLEHYSIITKGDPNSTAALSSTKMRVTVPALGAGI